MVIVTVGGDDLEHDDSFYSHVQYDDDFYCYYTIAIMFDALTVMIIVS